MSAREQAYVVAAAVRATLSQLPLEIRAAMERAEISIGELAAAIGNNAAQVLALQDEDES